MTVKIDWVKSHADGDRGALILYNDETDTHYGSWPFKTNPDFAGEKHIWKWETPDAPLEEITLSPSLRLDNEVLGPFHIFVRDGEIEHCGDCKCGCEQ